MRMHSEQIVVNVHSVCNVNRFASGAYYFHSVNTPLDVPFSLVELAFFVSEVEFKLNEFVYNHLLRLLLFALLDMF